MLMIKLMELREINQTDLTNKLFFEKEHSSPLKAMSNVIKNLNKVYLNYVQTESDYKKDNVKPE
jgi:hypothetical protein